MMKKISQNANQTLPNMAGGNTKGVIIPSETLFKTEFMPGEEAVETKQRKQGIGNSLNSIFASVHKRLRHRKVVTPSLAIEGGLNKAELSTLAIKQPVATKITSHATLPPNLDSQAKCNTSINQLMTSSSHMTNQDSHAKFKRGINQLNNSLRGLSIPQMKANWEQKTQQRLRRAIGRHADSNNFTSHHRVVEVLRQKRFLEEMLLEHQKLQRDRQSIAMEIKAMRNYLHDIREKLDSSLKKLNSKKSVCDRYHTKHKNLSVPTKNNVIIKPKGASTRGATKNTQTQRKVTIIRSEVKRSLSPDIAQKRKS